MSLTGIVFVLAFFAGLVLAFARHPIYGLYTYVAVFYIHPPSRWWGALLPDLRWALLAALVTLIATARLSEDKSRPSWHRTTPGRILLMFTAWVVIQNLWAISPKEHQELTVLYIKYVLLFYLTYRLIQTPEQMRDFMLVNLGGCAYLGLIAYGTTVSGRLEGVGGPGIDEANALAMQLGTAVMMGAMFILAERKWRLLFCLATMPFILNAIVLANSRGAFLAILVGGVVLWYLKPGSYRKLFYVYAALGVVLFVMVAQESFWSRMDTMKAGVDESQQMDNSAESRLYIIKAQWEMAKRNLLGTGHRGTVVLSPLYLDQKFMSKTNKPDDIGRRASHNTAMSYLVEQGIPGAFVYLGVWLWWAKCVRRLKRLGSLLPADLAGMGAGICAALAVVWAAGLFVDYLKAEIQIWLMVLLALIMNFSERCAAEHETAKAAKPSKKRISATSVVR